ncbi:MAG: hypothetical protein ACREND_06815 [Gemmatimonadaceae bacterium]
MSVRDEPQRDPARVIAALREQAFTIVPSTVGVSPEPGHQRAWAVIMETGYDAAVVSLVTIADGTTSLYFSNGGGIFGAGRHDAVRAASARFIQVADSRVGDLPEVVEHPLPAVGRVCLYVRTFQGLHGFEARGADLGNGRGSVQAELFRAGHDVISAVREATPPTKN